MPREMSEVTEGSEMKVNQIIQVKSETTERVEKLRTSQN